MYIALSAEAVEYTNCTSAKAYDLPITSDKIMALSKLLVRLQPYGFEECGVPFVAIDLGPLEPAVVASDKVLFMSQIEQTKFSNK